MGTFFKIIGSILLIGILLVVGILGYFGFIPQVSNLLGTNQPRDLGMEFNQIEYEKALTKAKVQLEKLPETSVEAISYSGSHQVVASFTDEELTAHAFNKDWEYYPVQDLQVRINNDGTAEIAGVIRFDRLDGFFESTGFGNFDYKAALAEANIPIKNVPFYAKGFGSAKDNKLDINVTAFEIGRIPVPQSILKENKGLVEDFGHTLINNIPGFYVNEARFEDGAIYFDGTLPDVEYTL